MNSEQANLFSVTRLFLKACFKWHTKKRWTLEIKKIESRIKISALGLTSCVTLGRMHLILLELFFICVIGIIMPTSENCHSFIHFYKQDFLVGSDRNLIDQLNKENIVKGYLVSHRIATRTREPALRLNFQDTTWNGIRTSLGHCYCLHNSHLAHFPLLHFPLPAGI